MKTKDAFALRDFDPKRILQRAPFRKFNLPDADDDEILQSLKATDTDSIDELERKLRVLDSLHATTRGYYRLLKRHEKRLAKLCGKFAEEYMKESTEKEKYKAQYARAVPLIHKYFEDVALRVGDLYAKQDDTYTGLDIDTKKRQRRLFADRLKQARQRTGATQAEFARKMRMPKDSYIAYELARNEPSLTTLTRLARILNQSTDQLLGVTS